MKTTSMGDRLLSITAGSLCTAGALAVLLDDVTKGAPWSLKHSLTVVTVAVTIMVGHLAAKAWRHRHVLGVVGFSVLFMVGTCLTVLTSVGRQAETSIMSEAEAIAQNDARTASKKALGEAATMLSGAQHDLALECKTGRGKRCEGIQATIDVYFAAVKGHQADLERLGPQKVVAPDAENFAEIAAVFGADKAKVKAATILIEPFCKTIFLEFGSIICLGFAFRRRAEPETKKAITETNRGAITDDEIEELRRLLKINRALDNNGVADALGVSKGEASKRVSRAVEAGIVSKVRDGRHVAIRLN